MGEEEFIKDVVGTVVKDRIVLDLDSFIKYIKYNFYENVEIFMKNNELWISMPLKLLFKYEMDGDKIVLILS